MLRLIKSPRSQQRKLLKQFNFKECAYLYLFGIVCAHNPYKV